MDGEKEIVLGNKQLISLFFVVVALCGIFFAMGYMMGRPSGKPLAGIPETTQATAATSTDAAPSPGVRETQESAGQQPEPPRETAPAGEAQPASPAPVTETQAAHDVPAPPPAPAAAAAPAVPEPGATYLQVTALRRSDADNLVKTLREQDLPALTAASSKADLFRVLVGPYHKTADVADAKARLKALGFDNAFVQK